jgi:hypothetical protein
MSAFVRHGTATLHAVLEPSRRVLVQKQNIILIPPSDEQAYPTFHVARELAGAFLAHLAHRHIEVRDTPEPIGRLGPRAQDVIEIEVKDDSHPLPALEKVVNDFFATRTVANE